MNRREPEEDRISMLSDDVLCHILSFLPIKEAMVTSLLSSRWRFVWTLVPSLRIQCLKPIMKFYDRINTFLDLRRTEKITRFHLRCNRHACCSRYLEECVHAVVARKVEQLYIFLCTCHRSEFWFSTSTLSTCTTIVTLKIHGKFDLGIPSSIHLPSIKILDLDISECIPFSHIKDLISGSPSLQLFHLKQKRHKHHIVEFNITQNSRHCRLFKRSWFHGRRIYDLEIQSHPRHNFIADYMEDRWLNIVKAKVYIKVYNGDKHYYVKKTVIKTLQGLSNVEFLSFTYLRVRDLAVFELPLLKNLVELRIFVKKTRSLYVVLPQRYPQLQVLLAKCPKLQVLEFKFIDDQFRV